MTTTVDTAAALGYLRTAFNLVNLVDHTLAISDPAIRRQMADTLASLDLLIAAIDDPDQVRA